MLNISLLPNWEYNMDFIFCAAGKKWLKTQLIENLDLSCLQFPVVCSDLYIYQRNFFD